MPLSCIFNLRSFSQAGRRGFLRLPVGTADPACRTFRPAVICRFLQHHSLSGSWVPPRPWLARDAAGYCSFKPNAYTFESYVVTNTLPPEIEIPLKCVQPGMVSPLEYSFFTVVAPNPESPASPCFSPPRSGDRPPPPSAPLDWRPPPPFEIAKPSPPATIGGSGKF